MSDRSRPAAVRARTAHASRCCLIVSLTLIAGDALAQTVRSGAGANAAALLPVVDQFRTDLGGGVVAGPHGAFGGLRREINWDAVPDALASPAELPADFFNTTSPRGVVFTPVDELAPTAHFRVSMDDDVPADADADEVLFSDLKPVYATEFQTFSPERLFTVQTANRLDVQFFLPGTTTPAVVRSFGVVFTGVELSFSTRMDLFDADDRFLGSYRPPVGALSFVGVSFPDARIGRVRISPGNTPLGIVDEFPNVLDVVAMDDFIYAEPVLRKYVLSEGATGTFFDTEIALANPLDADTEAQITFIEPDGSLVPINRTVPAKGRVTIPVESVEGLEATEVSTIVVPQNGRPLGVERTMRWDAGGYGGHTGEAVAAASTRWLFAEGVQGFFDTFFLVAHQNEAPVDVTFTFLFEDGPPLVKMVPVNPFTRKTVFAGDFAELKDRTFGVIVDATLPIVVERAAYFGSTPQQLWTGGHESPGVPAPAEEWLFSEGATGTFFDTFLLLMNPGDTDANVALKYLPEGGSAITVNHLVKGKQRVTINLETEDPALAAGAAGTQITSDEPIVAERAMYWTGTDGQPWTEGHDSFGATSSALRWLLAEGRSGGSPSYQTYILIAHPAAGTAEVTLTFLRESGTSITKQVTISANGRRTFDISVEAPELDGESFGVLVESTNGAQITVERSIYWNANGVFWAAGTNAIASPLSSFTP